LFAEEVFSPLCISSIPTPNLVGSIVYCRLSRRICNSYNILYVNTAASDIFKLNGKSLELTTRKTSDRLISNNLNKHNVMMALKYSKKA
jgi:hypothetical protein